MAISTGSGALREIAAFDAQRRRTDGHAQPRRKRRRHRDRADRLAHLAQHQPEAARQMAEQQAGRGAQVLLDGREGVVDIHLGPAQRRLAVAGDAPAFAAQPDLVRRTAELPGEFAARNDVLDAFAAQLGFLGVLLQLGERGNRLRERRKRRRCQHGRADAALARDQPHPADDAHRLADGLPARAVDVRQRGFRRKQAADRILAAVDVAREIAADRQVARRFRSGRTGPRRFGACAFHSAPAARSRANSCGAKPSLPRMSSVSAPSAGAGSHGISSPGQRTGGASMWTAPSGRAAARTRPSSLTNALSSAAFTSCTGAAGTLPANRSIHSAVVRADSAASSSTVSLSRLASRALKSL